jgi:hypothetical protein
LGAEEVAAALAADSINKFPDTLAAIVESYANIPAIVEFAAELIGAFVAFVVALGAL